MTADTPFYDETFFASHKREILEKWTIRYRWL